MTSTEGWSANGYSDGGESARFSLPPRPGLKSAKLTMLRTAKRTGVLDALRESRWRSRRLLILAYHGIALTDEAEWSPELFMPVPAMRERFTMLRDGGYNVIPLRDAVARLAAGTLPPRAVALTFDDGTHDFLAAGVPLLREFGFPATVYVTSYYAAKEVPVFRMACRYLTWAGRDRRIDGAGLVAGAGTLDLGTLDQRDAVVEAIEQYTASHGGGTAVEAACLRLLAERVGVDFDTFVMQQRLRIMSPTEIATLPRPLIDVQLHTHRHKVPLNGEAFRREIGDNRSALGAWCPGAKLDAFCYPSGVTDPRFLPWLRDLGIQSAVTCDPGLAESSTDPLLLPRLVDSWRLTRLEFEAWLTGAGALLPRVPRRKRYRPAAVYD